ncbi:MAG: hypothetical protein QW051_00255 [Candidatus Aenigmatarchaeota archaeon]
MREESQDKNKMENIRKAAVDFRIKKIEKLLSKKNIKRHEIYFLLAWAELYGYNELKKWCEEKLKEFENAGTK